MKRNLYVIRDNVAGAAVGAVMVQSHDAPAIRMFQDVANDERSMLHLHMADHDLLCLGAYDDEKCVIVEAEPAPRMVLSGAALKAMYDRAQEASTNG